MSNRRLCSGLIAGEDGKKEEADWKRLVTMIGKSGYRGYEDDAVKEVPRQAANLHTLRARYLH